MAGYLGNTPTEVPLTSADIQNGTINLVDLSATGTPSASTFLRGDNSWASAGATAGQVIQVVTATDSTERATTSASYATGSNTLAVTITPSSSANKILILLSTLGFQYNRGTWALFRGATNLTTNGIMYNDFPSDGTNVYIGYNFLDSPSSTSALTYQIYMKNSAGGSTYVNVNNSVGSITALEIKG